jgi:hypothetical protein
MRVLWSEQQKATAKPKSSAEEKTDLFTPAHSCSPKTLDTADFLIDGLPLFRPRCGLVDCMLNYLAV